MAKFDMQHGVKPYSAFNTYEFTGNEAKAGNIIDTLGYESVLLVFQSATLTDGVYTPSIEDGDDSALSDAAAVDTNFLLDSYADSTFVDTEDNTVKTLGLVNKKRYFKLTITSSVVTSGGTMTVGVILGNALHNPTQGENSPTG